MKILHICLKFLSVVATQTWIKNRETVSTAVKPWTCVPFSIWVTCMISLGVFVSFCRSSWTGTSARCRRTSSSCIRRRWTSPLSSACRKVTQEKVCHCHERRLFQQATASILSCIPFCYHDNLWVTVNKHTRLVRLKKKSSALREKEIPFNWKKEYKKNGVKDFQINFNPKVKEFTSSEMSGQKETRDERQKKKKDT